MSEIMKADDRILSDPAPQIAVSELADSSVNLVVRPWVKKEDYWNVKFDLTRKFKEAFDANGIDIPFHNRWSTCCRVLLDKIFEFPQNSRCNCENDRDWSGLVL